MVHEVEHGLHVTVGDSLEVEEDIGMLVPPEDVSEEGAAGTEDQFVSLNLFVITRQHNIKEFTLTSDVFEGWADVCLKVIPPKTKLFWGHGQVFSESKYWV